MLTHIVLFKLKELRPEQLATAKEKLLMLPNHIPQLRHLEVGTDILHSERSYDLALITRFDSLADMQAYQRHPIHVEAVTYLKTICQSIIAVDYEGDL